jgi:hypothetical protein
VNAAAYPDVLELTSGYQFSYLWFLETNPLRQLPWRFQSIRICVNHWS